jgi:hypothetical protein
MSDAQIKPPSSRFSATLRVLTRGSDATLTLFHATTHLYHIRHPHSQIGNAVLRHVFCNIPSMSALIYRNLPDRHTGSRRRRVFCKATSRQSQRESRNPPYRSDEAALVDFPKAGEFVTKRFDIIRRLDIVKIDAFKKIFVCRCHERCKSDGWRYQQGETAASSGSTLDYEPSRAKRKDFFERDSEHDETLARRKTKRPLAKG